MASVIFLSSRQRIGQLGTKIDSPRQARSSTRTTAIRYRSPQLRGRSVTDRGRIAANRPRIVTILPRTAAIRPRIAVILPRFAVIRPRKMIFRGRIVVFRGVSRGEKVATSPRNNESCARKWSHRQIWADSLSLRQLGDRGVGSDSAGQSAWPHTERVDSQAGSAELKRDRLGGDREPW